MRKVALLAMMLAMAMAFAAPAVAEVIKGTSGSDRLVGSDNEADRLFGRGGNDELFGESGPDLLIGGDGEDLLVGGEGEDVLKGGPGDDVIYTGTLSEGDKVSDQYSCGAGHDIVYLSGRDHASHNETGDCEEERHYQAA